MAAANMNSPAGATAGQYPSYVFDSLTLNNQVVSRGLRNVGPQALSLCNILPALSRPKVAYHLDLHVLPLSPRSFSGILSIETLKRLFKEGSKVFVNGQEERLGYRLGTPRA